MWEQTGQTGFASFLHHLVETSLCQLENYQQAIEWPLIQRKGVKTSLKKIVPSMLLFEKIVPVLSHLTTSSILKCCDHPWEIRKESVITIQLGGGGGKYDF